MRGPLLKKPKLALSMIVKDEEETLEMALISVKDYVDGIFIVDTGSTDKTVEIAKKFGAHVKEVGDRFRKPLIKGREPIFLFDRARNFALSLIPPEEYEFFLWIDADDVVLNAENIPAVLERMQREKLDAVYFNYIYQAELDERGRIKARLIEHLRERIIRHNGKHKWVGHLHETLVAQTDDVRYVDDTRVEVLHLLTPEKFREKARRNRKTLEQMIEKEKRSDPRTLYSLAKVYFDIREDNPRKYIPLAKALIEEYLEKSGWAQERSQAWNYLVEIYREGGDLEKAEEASYKAIREFPKLPEHYLNLGLTCVAKKDWEAARHWLQVATRMEQPQTMTIIRNPKQNKLRALEILYHVSLNTYDLDEARAAARALVKLLPGNQEMQKRLQLVEALYQEKLLTAAYITAGQYLERQHDIGRLRALVQAIPLVIADNPLMSQMINDVLPPRRWDENEIAIYCGPGFETWSPKSIHKGLGGSEEAVIYLTRELKKLGWQVTVYADPGSERGLHDGVNYLHHYEFNARDEFNILIGWRNPMLFTHHKLRARQKYLWLHDIPDPLHYYKLVEDEIKVEPGIQELNKIFVLSQWHRERLPRLPDEKFYITANGINLKQFPKPEKVIGYPRDPHRMIYTSSYDRGLEHLLRMWPQIRQEVPDANLHVFYGWNLFDKFYSDNPERMQWKKTINELLAQPGISHHGRVGQEKIIEETLKSAIWAYPTHFGEISCISAMKAQAAGAVPVVINYAALKETVKFGVKVEGDIYQPEVKEKYLQALVSLLKDGKRQKEIRKEMVPAAQKMFSWTKVAQDWHNLFKKKHASNQR